MDEERSSGWLVGLVLTALVCAVGLAGVAGVLWWRESAAEDAVIRLRVHPGPSRAFEEARAEWESWPGVARVVVSSDLPAAEPCLLVRPDPARLEAHGLGAEDVERALERALAGRGAVITRQGDGAFLVRTESGVNLLDLKLSELFDTKLEGVGAAELPLREVASIELSTLEPAERTEPIDVTIELANRSAHGEVRDALEAGLRARPGGPTFEFVR